MLASRRNSGGIVKSFVLARHRKPASRKNNREPYETFLPTVRSEPGSISWLLNIHQTGDDQMTFFKLAAAAGLLTVLPMSAMAAEMPSADQCSAWFTKADTNGDGSLGQQEDAAKYAGMISKSSVADQNNSTAADALILKKEAFMKYCGEGTFGMPTG
jgi:hypothetical protein